MGGVGGIPSPCGELIPRLLPHTAQSAVVRAPEMDAFMRDWQPESLERFLCGETTGDSPHDALLTDPLAAYRDATPRTNRVCTNTRSV